MLVSNEIIIIYLQLVKNVQNKLIETNYLSTGFHLHIIHEQLSFFQFLIIILNLYILSRFYAV